MLTRLPGINRVGLKTLKILVYLGLLLVIQVQLTQALAYGADGPRLTLQEQWVLEQVKAGKEADLKKRFGAAVKLPAAFLEKLLTGGFPKFPIPRPGVQISHAIIEEPLDLTFAEVSHYIRLSRCVFRQAVNFQNSHFNKPLFLNGSHFYGPANFEAIKIDGDLLCDDAVFEKEVAWTAATIGGKFYAERAEFRSKEEDAIFNGMKVSYSVFLNSAKFYGAVNFVVASIGRHLLADGAEFLSPGKSVDFKNIKVGMSVYLKKAQFHGPVTFQSSEITEHFRLNEAKFFTKKIAVFTRLKVGQKIFFDVDTIRCAVDMSYGNFYDLEIRGREKDEQGQRIKSIDIPSLNLKGGLIQRDLIMEGVKIANLEANYLQVKGPAKFNDVEITTAADFRNSVFQNLDFTNVTWPGKDLAKNVRQIYLSDLTYNSISIDKPDNVDYQPADFQKIKAWVEAGPFNTQSYVQLEAFFKRIGRENWANEVFIRMHDRELAEKMAWWDPRRWLEWFFWGRIAGYGRAPFRVFFLSLALIILGAFLYDPIHLKTSKDPRESKKYELIAMRCFLSLDRFLPIELGLAKNWDAKANKFFIWLYFYLELILGWILIPIALASIYSQLK